MLETLLESKSRSERSAVGGMVSFGAHAALIAAAIYATENAGVQSTPPSETLHPIYFPRLFNPVQAATPATTMPSRSFESRMIFVEPRLDINAPRIDVGEIGATRTDFASGSVATEATVGGGGANSGAAPLSASQVDKQVVPLAGNAPPRYPEVLRNAGIEGQVVALFVVDGQGRPEEGSIRFARSDNSLFEDAVRAALLRMRFAPAEVGGIKVRQLVQMPFLFTLAR